MGKQWTVTEFIFSGSEITADGDCSHEIKRCLPLGWKAMTNPDSILKKQRHYFADKGPSSQSYGFFSSHIWLWELSCKGSWAPRNWWFLNCGVGEDSWQSLGLQGNPASLSLRKSVLNIHWEDWCWTWNSSTLATWWEELTHLKRPWCWEGLRAGGEGDDRGWDGWMASLTQWTWVWASCGSCWWAGKPSLLQSMGSQRDTTEQLNWTEKMINDFYKLEKIRRKQWKVVHMNEMQCDKETEICI